MKNPAWDVRQFALSCMIAPIRTEVGVVQHGCDANETSSTTGHNSHVLPRVLAVFALAVVRIVQIGDCHAKWLDTSRGAVFTTIHRNVERVRTLKTAFDIIVDFGSPLAQVGPLVGSIGEAMLLCTL